MTEDSSTQLPDVLVLPIWPGTLTAIEVRDLLGKENPVILEIGANCGQTTAEFLRVLPGATIYAFEPDPRAIAKFRRNISHPRVQLQECAVGTLNGTISFHQSSGAEDQTEYPDGWDQSGSIRKPQSHLQAWPWVKFDRQIDVPIVRLDDWAEQHGVHSVDFIWADVQGAEGDLIEGASQTLKCTRYFYTEYSNKEWFEGQVSLPQIAEMLPGFELARRYRAEALFRSRNPG